MTCPKTTEEKTSQDKEVNFLDRFELIKEWQRMLTYPRVIKAEDLPTAEGQPVWNQYIIRWTINSPATSIANFIHHFAPGAASQKHGHVGDALFYVLDGKGYEIHDGVKYEWEAGDVVIVHPGGCVHQHFNGDPDKPAKVWVFHCSPLYKALNLMAARLIAPPPGMTLEEFRRDSHPKMKTRRQDGQEEGE